MAHSDVLIFLTNITWVFLLFLFCYFFFVTFFLPSFYKTVRVRVLVRRKALVASAIYIRELVGLELFSTDLLLMLKDVFSAKLSELRFLFLTRPISLVGLDLSSRISSPSSAFLLGLGKYLLFKRDSQHRISYLRFSSSR